MGTKAIVNRFSAFGTYSTSDKAPRDEEVHIANAAIAAGVVVVYDPLYPAATSSHMRVITASAVNPVTSIGVSATAALFAGDEVRVVTRGPVQATGSAVVAIGLGLGVAATGATAASAAPSATIKNIGFALEAAGVGTSTWVYVAPW